MVEVEGAPKLAISCNEFVRDGMVVHTNSERVLKSRAAVLEFLLINHPLDCSVCDKSGECMLQDYTYEHRKYPADAYIDTRMSLQKIVPSTKELSSKIWLWANRCIHCSRCVRFTDEISGTAELTFVQRGAKAEIDCHPDKPLENNISANVVDLCPVGALLDKDFLYQSRVWFLDKRDSICPHCSKGCNVSIESFRNEVKRLKPRANEAVNDYWMCDSGRHNREYFELDRIQAPELRNGSGMQETSRQAALKAIAEKLAEIPEGTIAGLGSAQCTCEDNYALKLLVEQLGGSAFAVRETHIGDTEKFKKFTIEAEKAPNRHGALAVLGVPTVGTDELCDKIKSGKIKALVALGNELHVPLSDKERKAFAKLDYLVVLDSWRSPLAEMAHAVLPGAIYAEKEGTFVNSNGRAQHLSQSLLPEGGQAASEWIWLKRLSDALDGGLEFNSPSKLFNHLAKKLPAFAGLSYAQLGDAGAPIKD
jgi:NADH-quinone oxidoreductase subunit G